MGCEESARMWKSFWTNRCCEDAEDILIVAIGLASTLPQKHGDVLKNYVYCEYEIYKVEKAKGQLYREISRKLILADLPGG